MTYLERLKAIIIKIDASLVDFDKERSRGNPPTQVSSEFLTNKEQGDWAEKTLLNAINKNSEQYIAVKYGRDDDIVAGDDNFNKFYEEYQNELDEIGKRPDILIFNRSDFQFDTYNISNFSRKDLDMLVPKAKCGIEVRSSAFLFEEYEAFMNEKQQELLHEALELKQKILEKYGELLLKKNCKLHKIIYDLSSENLRIINFRCPSWKKTEQLADLSLCLKELKQVISKMNKRTFLSITPKVEDLKLVYAWVKKYRVPHFYVQVFFDKAYGISFEKILSLISSPELEGIEYFVESDIKNQNKTTIKIHTSKANNVLEKINIPEHFSEAKKLGRGRLLFYVKFKDSISSLNKESFENLFGFKL